MVVEYPHPAAAGAVFEQRAVENLLVGEPARSAVEAGVLDGVRPFCETVPNVVGVPNAEDLPPRSRERGVVADRDLAARQEAVAIGDEVILGDPRRRAVEVALI